MLRSPLPGFVPRWLLAVAAALAGTAATLPAEEPVAVLTRVFNGYTRPRSLWVNSCVPPYSSADNKIHA